MSKWRDPYLAGWNAAIEAAARECKRQARAWEKIARGHCTEADVLDDAADLIRLLAKPDPIDDQWRRVNDGDCGVSHD